MRAHHVVHCCCEGEATSHAAFGACCTVPRHFRSKEERREALEAYRTQLKSELAGLEERLEELDK